MKNLINPCDNLYGKCVVAECQSQINVNEWTGKEDYNFYITQFLNKNIEFFLIWTKMRTRVVCFIDIPSDEILGNKDIGTKKGDYIMGRRVIVWSRDADFEPRIKKTRHGHRKQGGIFNEHTFCVKDSKIRLSRSLR